MLGAGFSRNADKISDEVQDYALWGGLVEKMQAELYPEEVITQRDIENITKSGGALKIAEEYKVNFGRDSLDRLLIENVNDRSYNPGQIHELLLKLPWADIFTTNYDTLIERATTDVRTWAVNKTSGESCGC